MKLIYPACFYPNDSNGYTVVFPDLKGAVTEGTTLAEAFEMAVDCASGWVLDELKEGRKAPPASDLKEISADEFPNGFVNAVLIDMDSYAEKCGQKAVRKNCTIPAWLNTFAERSNVNFSQILQDALKEKLGLE